MVRRILLLAGVSVLLHAPAAGAVPLQLAHQGRLLDGADAPLEGDHELTFRLFDAPEDGALLWEETVSATLTGGFYSAILGADADANPLDEDVFASPPVYLELTVGDGAPLLPRQELVSAPFALRAGTAENLEGGYADASEVYIDGDLVIDAGGAWVGPPPVVGWEDVTGVPDGLGDGVDDDALGGLSCDDGGVAKFDLASGLWTCAADLVLSDAEVLDAVAGGVLDLGAGSSVGGVAIATLDDLGDTLLDLGPACADGDRAAWDLGAGVWGCVPEEVALDRLETAGAAAGQVLTFDGVTVGWEDASSTTNPPCTLTELNEPLSFAAADCGSTPVLLRTWMHLTRVAAGNDHSCGIDAAGGLRCWGYNSWGQLAAPAGTFTEIDAGSLFTCALEAAGGIQCWGNDGNGQSTPPPGTFTRLTTGGAHACAIDGASALHCWGNDEYGQATPPGGAFTEVSAGSEHTCALTTGGALECWGRDLFGQLTPPGGSFTQLGLGQHHGCAIDGGGALQCWGRNDSLQSNPPAGLFTAVTGGAAHSCAIEAGGAVQCWGAADQGQTTPPVGSFAWVDAGQSHTCGVVATYGRGACWGHDGTGQSSPP